MLKLYTSPGACSMACDIILEEAGLPFERKIVKFDEGFLDSPAFKKLNPNGAVPCLEIEPGVALTEGVAILQFIANKKPELNLFPTNKNSIEYFRAVEWLNFISTELHSKTFSNLWGAEDMVTDATARTDFNTVVTTQLKEKLEYVDRKLQGNTYCMGNQYTVVDAYLFTIVGWTKFFKIDMAPYKNLTGFQNRVFERPATQRAMKAVGVIK